MKCKFKNVMAAFVIGIVMLSCVVFDSYATVSAPTRGDGWALDAKGTLTIQNDTGMANWTETWRTTSNIDKQNAIVKTVIVQESVTSVQTQAFTACTTVTRVEILNGVTGIEDEAFSGCSNLASITIPHSVLSIGKNVFNQDEKLNILGEKDSYAETYAESNHIPFSVSLQSGDWLEKITIVVALVCVVIILILIFALSHAKYKARREMEGMRQAVHAAETIAERAKAEERQRRLSKGAAPRQPRNIPIRQAYISPRDIHGREDSRNLYSHSWQDPKNNQPVRQSSTSVQQREGPPVVPLLTTRFCSKCGTPREPGARFCIKCGRPFES